MFRRRWLLAVVLLGLQFQGIGARMTAAVQTELQEYLVVGTVVRVHPESSSITIRQANLFGNLHLLVKFYRVKLAGSLEGLRPGDKIMAVFSSKDGMLHRLRHVQPPQAQVRRN